MHICEYNLYDGLLGPAILFAITSFQSFMAKSMAAMLHISLFARSLPTRLLG